MKNETPLGTQGLYVITTEDQWPSKIGITDNMAQRLDHLQVGSWLHLSVVAFWFPYTSIKMDELNLDKRLRVNRMNTARLASQVMERAVHRKLKEFDLHVRGEWFDITAKEAIEVVLKVAKTDGFRLVHPKDILAAKPEALTRTAEVLALQEMLRVANSALEALTRAR